MSSPTADASTTALSTLTLLETRLRRIEFLLTGSADLEGQPTSLQSRTKPVSSRDTVAGRLKQLQDNLNKLRKLSGPAGDLIRDVESLHTQVPEIFADSTSTSLTPLSDQTTHIFANTSLYTETASRLSSLQTLQVPPADQSGQLVDLQPRLEVAMAKEMELEEQARELRERSVRCLEWWVKFGVVGMGEVWTDWEDRVHEAERQVSRVERMKADREGYV